VGRPGGTSWQGAVGCLAMIVSTVLVIAAVTAFAVLGHAAHLW
jgi:hypothetical protein